MRIKLKIYEICRCTKYNIQIMIQKLIINRNKSNINNDLIIQFNIYIIKKYFLDKRVIISKKQENF